MQKGLIRKVVVLTVSVGLVFIGFKFFSVYFLKKAVDSPDNKTKLYYLSKAISMQNDEARLIRAMTYIDMKQSTAAMTDLQYVAKTQPQYPVTFMYIGNVYYDLGDYPASLSAYDTAQRLLPAYIDQELTNNKSAGKLTAAYGLTANQVADNLRVKLLLDRVGTLAAMRRFADALIDTEKARAISPADPYVYLTRSKIYEQIGNKKLAVQDYNQAFMLKKQQEEAMQKISRQIADRLAKQQTVAKSTAAPAKK